MGGFNDPISSLGNLSGSQAAILGGLAGGAGFLGQNQNTNSTTNQNSTIAQTGSATNYGNTASNINTQGTLQGQTAQTQGTTNTLSPEAAAILSQIMGQSGNLQPFNASQYQGQANNQINQAAQSQQTNAANEAAARGLSTSPTAAVTAQNIDANRIGQQVQVTNSIPQIAQQFAQSNIAALSPVLASLPKNSTTTGTGTNTQQQTGSQVGTGTSTGGSTSQNQQVGNSTSNTQSQTQTGGGLGGVLSGVGGLLGTLFGLGG